MVGSTTDFLFDKNGRFCSDLPYFIHLIIFKMQKRRIDAKAPSKKLLRKIKSDLQLLNPKLKRLKVKQYYNKGKVVAHADLGKRRIHVKGNKENILEKFISQYKERVITAF